MNNVTVIVKDRGAKRARQLLKKNRLELWLGVLEAQGAQRHPSGETIGTIAWWMEVGFHAGSRWVGPRSWLRDWADENEKLIQKQLAADTYRVIFANESERKVLAKRGGEYRRSMWSRIRAVPSDWDALAESTIRKKGHDAPLIETTEFINAIRWEVR